METIEFGFTNKTLRQNFIKKVYSIISIQLLATTIMISLVYINPEGFKKFNNDNQYIIAIAMIIKIITLYGLGCYISLSRKFPINYIFLSLFTLSTSYILSCFVLLFKVKTVFAAALLTLGVTIGITIYAFTTKQDFTVCGGLLFGMSIGFIFLLITFAITREKYLYTFIGYLGLALYCIYWIYDTQLLMDNKANSLTVDDYIYAAFNIYLDIVQIFVYILRILGNNNN